MKNRFRDLADRSYNTGTYTFTDFLGLADISDLLSMEKELSYAGIKLYGGYEGAERKIARFGREDELMYDMPFPIVCLHIKPLMKKFADELTHRDFLGALMNLGIERSTVGDIKVLEKEAYIFCQDTIAEFIKDSLTRIRHTSVMCEMTKVDDINVINVNEEPKERTIIVSSERIDGIISKVYNLSRNDSLELFRTQKVYINGRLCENNSAKAKLDDVINARGFGKFKIGTQPRETRKGRISLDIMVW